jgi:eukaryotic-like serine/threonine-protein kinase
VPLMLMAKLQAGRITAAEFEARRNDWAATWRRLAPPFYAPWVWLRGWAALVETPEQARAAMAALGGEGTIPPYRYWVTDDARTGWTLLLAGHDEGLSVVENAAARCLTLVRPLQQTQAQWLLGRAREIRDDQAGACAAYRVVLDRWGHARPRSVTAERAAIRARSLRCP